MSGLSEEEILREAERKTGDAYKEAPTVANLREWKAAKAALAEFEQTQQKEASGRTFKNLSEVARYLIQERYKVQDRTVRNHHKSGYFHAQPGGGFRQQDIDRYAKDHLDRPGYADPGASLENDHRARLIKAQAEEREYRNAKLKGELIDAAEEEARDARLWKAIKADVEQQAPGVINELVEEVLALDPPEPLRVKILALIPGLREKYEDYIAEMFDRYARQGGVYVE